MDVRYEQVMNKLNELSTTHPNLSNVWREFINVKKERFEYTLDKCLENMNNMSNIDDPSNDTLVFLLYFYNSDNIT